MCILNIDLNNISLDNNSDEGDPETTSDKTFDLAN